MDEETDAEDEPIVVDDDDQTTRPSKTVATGKARASPAPAKPKPRPTKKSEQPNPAKRTKSASEDESVHEQHQLSTRRSSQANGIGRANGVSTGGGPTVTALQREIDRLKKVQERETAKHARMYAALEQENERLTNEVTLVSPHTYHMLKPISNCLLCTFR